MSQGGNALRRALADKGRWPLYAILLISLVFVVGRGCGGSTTGTSPAVATSAATVLSSPWSAATPSSVRGATSRGPAGNPVTPSDRSIARCDIDRLPPETLRTVDLVRRGGPFPYPRNDGVTFRNAEHLLPVRAASYYREYTVPTPTSADRGVRRVITGGDPAANPPIWYYTGDHYDTFCEITGLS